MWWLDSGDLTLLAREQQTGRYDADPWQELIADWTEPRESVSIGEVLENCLNKPQAQWMPADKESDRALPARVGVGTISGMARNAAGMALPKSGYAGVNVTSITSVFVRSQRVTGGGYIFHITGDSDDNGELFDNESFPANKNW